MPTLAVRPIERHLGIGRPVAANPVDLGHRRENRGRTGVAETKEILRELPAPDGLDAFQAAEPMLGMDHDIADAKFGFRQ